MRCDTTAIAALVPRQRSRVAGDLQSVTAYERPWVRTDAVLVDGTVLIDFLIARQHLQRNRGEIVGNG